MKGTWTHGMAALTLVLFFPSVALKLTAQEKPGADRLAPPRSLDDSLKQGAIRVSNATLTPISSDAQSTTARLAVTFAPRRVGGPSVTIRPDGKAVTLQDDGTGGDSLARDGVFTGMILLDAAEIGREQRTAEQLQRTQQIQEFRGRVRLEPRKLPAEAFQDLRKPSLLKSSPVVIFAIADQLLKDRSLMITDPAVIGDPLRTYDLCSGKGTRMGKWTFGYLMTQLATGSGRTAADFTRDWLHQWEIPESANSFTIPARPAITSIIINPWPRFVPFPWIPRPGRLNLAEAPFRLLAIVNRVDLRQNLVYGGGSAGEARFIFEAIDRRPATPGGPPQCRSLPFTVIFEYGIHKNSCSEVRAWGQQWYDLRNFASSSTQYRDALEKITEQFVPAGTNPAQLPNKSSLSQLRTNERAIGRPWELREFKLAGLLFSTTVKREPDMSFHDTDRLVQWINANSTAIVNGTHVVPELLPDGTHFLGARAPIPGDNTSFIWDRGHDITAANARQMFSLGTCSGCHTGETQTQFTHVKPGVMRPPTLSGFLTGISVTDPDATDTDNSVRVYSDLERRALDLDGLVNSACFRQLVFNNISMMTH
jgi:hypothetical protein